ncbi:hypothetical protein UY3_00327 [Chelonia mydas]|uniref:Uncharacterized protein n=1 Tax=Chelonia mydas TaxID=8469 RepID=M7BX28_CHEMY|nr:hypothetical protein UY3_00327 [Chelonia mydas]
MAVDFGGTPAAAPPPPSSVACLWQVLLWLPLPWHFPSPLEAAKKVEPALHVQEPWILTIKHQLKAQCSAGTILDPARSYSVFFVKEPLNLSDIMCQMNLDMVLESDGKAGEHEYGQQNKPN